MNRKERRQIDKASQQERLQIIDNYIKTEISRALENQVPISFYRGWLFAYSEIQSNYIDKYIATTDAKERSDIIESLILDLEKMRPQIEKEINRQRGIEEQSKQPEKVEEEGDKQ